MHRVHHDELAREQLSLGLDEIARRGARQLLAQALQAEVDALTSKPPKASATSTPGTPCSSATATTTTAGYPAGPRHDRGEGSEGHNDRRVEETTGERRRFGSVILPPYYMRRSPKVTEVVLPLLYPHGLSGGDFAPALEGFFGTGAGLSPASITRLTEQWQKEREAFMERDLSEKDYVYAWVDGIRTEVRLGGDDRLCCLVMVGARIDGKKELIALQEGYRESTESWAELLRDLKKRGMRAPVLAVGDGASGFWGAVRDAFPQRPAISATGCTKPPTRSTRCPKACVKGPRRP